MSKSLSNGTLSLKFMQNALRRQQLQEVELERAEIKDEGKWEVGPEVKEAWGIGENQSSDVVVHESSYIPFLFSSEREDAATHTQKPRGRRMFNKKGLEVSQEQSQSQPQHGNADNDDNAHDGEDDSLNPENDNNGKSKGRKSGIHTNPRPISSNSLGYSRLKGFDTLDGKPNRGSRSARDAIFSLSGVGTDLRDSRKRPADDELPEDNEQKPKRQQPLSSTTGFLKPVGVDEPATRNPTSPSSSKTETLLPSKPKVVRGARKKRPRDPNEPAGEGRKKRNIKPPPLSRRAEGAE